MYHWGSSKRRGRHQSRSISGRTAVPVTGGEGSPRAAPLFFTLLLVIPAGFATKFYSGPAQFWVRNSLGGFFYVVFWCLLGALLFPALRAGRIAAWVVSATCLLEVVQLWHPWFLEYLRGSFLGRVLLGTTFVWSDFAYYFLGGLVGWLIIRRLR